MNKKYLKRVISLLCMIVMCFGLTACGFKESKTIDTASVKMQSKQTIIDTYETSIKQWVIDFITYLDARSEDGLISDANNNISLYDITGNRYLVNYYGFNDSTVQVYNTWNATRDELGKLNKIDTDSIKITPSKETGKLCVISASAAYEKNEEVNFEFTIDDEYYISGAAINPTYSTSQKLYKAAMNTVIGMGTVFVVLIFISFIISLFKFINKFQNRKQEQKVENEKDDKEIVENNESEELVDDLELVAVITAAITAYEGEKNSNGLVIRSIRRKR
jgi:sodium pump decarboxylase gamma subunit